MVVNDELLEIIVNQRELKNDIEAIIEEVRRMIDEEAARTEEKFPGNQWKSEGDEQAVRRTGKENCSGKRAS